MTPAMRAAWFSDQFLRKWVGKGRGRWVGRTVTPVVFILVISLSMNVFTNLVLNSALLSFRISMRILRDQSRGTRSEKTRLKTNPTEVSIVRGIDCLIGRGLDFSTSPLAFVIVVGRVCCCAFDIVKGHLKVVGLESSGFHGLFQPPSDDGGRLSLKDGCMISAWDLYLPRLVGSAGPSLLLTHDKVSSWLCSMRILEP